MLFRPYPDVPRAAAALALVLAFAACESSSYRPYADDADGGTHADAAPADAPVANVPDAPAADAGTLADAAEVADGVPVRRACTNDYGSALTTLHGRLDGTLVSIVAPGVHGCNGDSGHVHLQVEMNGATYDVAINVESAPEPVEYLARDLPLPDGPWSEGWHTDSAGTLDYTALGVHAADFTPMSQDDLVAELDAELAQVNHISVFMIGYGPDGGHNVHRVGPLRDGALVLRPLSASPRLLMFHFADQSF
jgi:hypothetical protein